MLLAFIDDNSKRIILWVVLVAAVLGLIALLLHTLIIYRRNKNNNGAASVTDNGGNEALSEDADDVQFAADQIVMSRNVIYSVGVDGLKAGQYTLSAADTSADKFNVRVNGLVREYSDGDVLVLTEGDTVSPVSGSVVISITKE